MIPAANLLFDTLCADIDELVSRCHDAALAAIPSYRTLHAESLDAGLRLDIEQVLRSARSGRTSVNEAELSELASVGEERARQGVPIADLLRAWRISIEVIIGYAHEVGQRLGIEDTYVLESIRSGLAWSDVAMVVTAEAHRKAEFALRYAERGQGAQLARGVLFGEMPAADIQIAAEALGMDSTGTYIAVRARGVAGTSVHELEHVLGFGDSTQQCSGVYALVDGDVAGFLREPPPADVDAVVGYGPPRPLDQLPESYRLATRALMTALACGFRGAHDIRSLGVRTAVAADTDVGEWLRLRYLEPLRRKGASQELVSTLRAYFACGLHVERAARQLFVHQNTVRYRLARFEELTGADLRDPEVLVEVWWALERSAMEFVADSKI